MNTSLITKSQGKLKINQAQQGILQSMHPQRASGKHLFLISAVVFIPFFFFFTRSLRSTVKPLVPRGGTI